MVKHQTTVFSEMSCLVASYCYISRASSSLSHMFISHQSAVKDQTFINCVLLASQLYKLQPLLMGHRLSLVLFLSYDDQSSNKPFLRDDDVADAMHHKARRSWFKYWQGPFHAHIAC